MLVLNGCKIGDESLPRGEEVRSFVLAEKEVAKISGSLGRVEKGERHRVIT